MTHRIEHGIDVKVPVATAYDQWTQFEDFPRFMRHVESVQRLDDTHLRWRVKLGGKTREFDCEIVEQISDERIRWRSTDGARHSGVVTFHRLADDACRVMLQLEYAPKGLLEKVGAFIAIPALDVEKDMKRFAEFIERRHVATGAWRGSVANRDEQQEGP